MDKNFKPLHTHFLNAGNRKFIGHTNHEWRKMKRAELLKLEKAAYKFINGSDFTPFSALHAPTTPMNLLDLIRHMKDQLSVTNWGK